MGANEIVVIQTTFSTGNLGELISGELAGLLFGGLGLLLVHQVVAAHDNLSFLLDGYALARNTSGMLLPINPTSILV